MFTFLYCKTNDNRKLFHKLYCTVLTAIQCSLTHWHQES